MKSNISVIITAANDQKIIKDCLKSVFWAEEKILVLSEISIDSTYKIACQYTDKIYKTLNNLGYQRNYGIKKSSGDWILILDSDERISNELAREIQMETRNSKYNGYYIQYQNYFLIHKLKYGNQGYKKLRLFRRNYGHIETEIIHPDILVTGLVGMLKGKILHYSFRSIPQTLKKFTYYASIEARIKHEKGERISLKKLTLYPLHMFWSMFIEDQGYKDGIWGFGLAVCFAYYELARYIYLLLIEIRERV